MNGITWVQLIASFFTGGAFGAFIKQYFDNRRNRIQPINYKLELKKFFDSSSDNMLASRIVIEEGSKHYKFETLYTGSFMIFNVGNIDYQEFQLGFTYDDESKFIQIKSNNTDRHHRAGFNQLPSLENQISQFDVTLKPFNRRDKYYFDFIVSTDDYFFSLDSLKISTTHSVRLRKVNADTETLNSIGRILFSPWPDLAALFHKKSEG